eukprot:m.53411 g.53411  ORF g.53411 m.53411 type:complete len:191 (+) comp7665_c0_seq4:58-630(+)
MGKVLTIVHGGDKYKFTVDDGATVGDVMELIEKEVKVEKGNQKLIIKGKQLKDESATLTSLKIKSKAKITLIGNKEDPVDTSCKKAFAETEQSYKQQGILLNTCQEEWDGIEKGFLDKVLIPEAVKKLKKNVLKANEMNVRLLVKLDSLPITEDMRQMRASRKVHISAIEKQLSAGDDLLLKIEALETMK